MRRGRRRAWRLAIALSIAPGVAGVPAAALADAAPELRTNVELAEEAIRGAIGDAFRTLPRSDSPVRVVPLGSSDVNPLVESVLVEEMAARGILVEIATPAEAAGLGAALDEADAAGDDSSAAAAEGADTSAASPASAVSGDPAPPAGSDDVGTLEERLFFRVTDFSFRYADIYRKLFVGPKRIRRLAKADLHFRLAHAGSRAVVWSENAAHSAADVIPYGKAELLESKTFAFAKPERAAGTLARIYEPLIVTGIVGGLVFLFYSNQSGD